MSSSTRSDPSSASARPYDVAIVGAGVAGLSAAAALTGHGATVVVLEARDRVGGRLLSRSDARGAVVDLGATWFWPDESLVSGLADDLSVATFAQHVAGDALFEPDRSTVQRLDGNPLDGPSTRFTGGAQALAVGAADRLPPGVLHLGNPVTAITVADDGVRVDAAGGSVLADDVVLAVPPALAVDRIEFDPPMPGDLRELATSTAVWMGDVVKAVATFDEPFWRAAELSGSAVSYAGPFRQFHDHSGPSGNPAALFAFAAAAHVGHLESDAIDVAFRDQLVRMFGATALRVRSTHVVDWSREPFTAPRRLAAQASTKTFGAAAFRQPVHDRVYWASTETATAHAGHIEGAIRAGLDVARILSSKQRRRDG